MGSFKSALKQLLCHVNDDIHLHKYHLANGHHTPAVEGVPAVGAAFRFTPALKRQEYIIDWLEAKVRAAGADLEPYHTHHVVFFIHWPTFFKQAFTGERGYAEHAHNILRSQVNLIRGYDVILAQMLKQPFLVQNIALNNSARLHVERLFNSSFATMFSAAVKQACEVLAPAPMLQRHYAKCYSCIATTNEYTRQGLTEVTTFEEEGRCPQCRDRKALVRQSLCIDTKYITRPDDVLLIPEPKQFWHGRTSPKGSRLVSDLCWIRSGLDDEYDGASTVGATTAVHWDVYVQRLIAPLVRLPRTHWKSYLNAVSALRVTETTLNRISAIFAYGNKPDAAIAALADEASKLLEPYGLTTNRVGPHCIEYRTFQLNMLLSEQASKRMQQRLKFLKRGLKHRAPRGLGTSRTYLSLTGPGDQEVAIRRHGKRWSVGFFAPPLVRGIALPPYVAKQRNQFLIESFGENWKQEEFVEGRYFWDESELRTYIDAHGDSYEIPELRTMYSWFVAQTEQYEKNPMLYLRARRSQRNAARVLRSHTGERKTVGWFLPEERDILQQFLAERTLQDTGRAFRGPFTELEWKVLEERLPNRSRATILKKTNELGLEYAKKTSWVEYLKSGYGISKAGKRREAWKALGVKWD